LIGKSQEGGTLAQLGERRVHTAEVTGSIPVRPTILSLRVFRIAGPVAQLDRALASGARGRRFESCLGHHLCRARTPSSATPLARSNTVPGSGTRRAEAARGRSPWPRGVRGARPPNGEG